VVELQKYKGYDPDELKYSAEDARSVIFVNGELFVDPETGRTHRSMFNRGVGKSADRLRSLLLPHMSPQPDGSDGWFGLYSTYLFGRVGTVVDQDTGETLRVASFWGRGADYMTQGAKGPADQVPACVQALYHKGLVDDDTVVVYGDGRVALAGELLAGGTPEVEPDQEVIDKVELAKRMHLARGGEKKEIMKKLGVGGGGSEKKQPWDVELQRLGLLAPGHQHWRMNSEGFERRLDRSLRML